VEGSQSKSDVARKLGIVTMPTAITPPEIKMRNPLPTREAVVARLREARSSDSYREEAAAWAFSYLGDDDIDVNDHDVWRALILLGAADLPSSDREYLYVDEDFVAVEDRLTQTT